MILNKSNYFNQNENNKSNRSFNKEKNFYEKTFNRTMSQNDIYYYKNIK